MRKIVLSLALAFAATTFMAPKAHALLELRLNYGVHTVNPDDVTGGSLPTLTDLSGLGFDGVVTLPMVPVGFGLRYEQLNSVKTAGSEEISVDFNSVSALVNYRLWDTGFYVGFVGTMGLSPSSKMTTKISGTTTNYTAGSASNYSIGVEGGIHLLGFLVGAEAGQSSFVGNDYSDGTNSVSKMDLVGPYVKLQVGLSF